MGDDGADALSVTVPPTVVVCRVVTCEATALSPSARAVASVCIAAALAAILVSSVATHELPL